MGVSDRSKYIGKTILQNTVGTVVALSKENVIVVVGGNNISSDVDRAIH